MLFLFQTGSIKRSSPKAWRGGWAGFYSKLVRLKDLKAVPPKMGHISFYSKLVRLKATLTGAIAPSRM